MQRRMLIQESAEHTPRRIHTGSGGKKIERITRQRSDMQSQQHILLASMWVDGLVMGCEGQITVSRDDRSRAQGFRGS